ncbi:TPA: hypothetical protein DEP94_01795 [Candidatus Nomurabacteria bacterium]|nr:hypothetical protein [Candidatus Nomurabacteria bacterium]
MKNFIAIIIAVVIIGGAGYFIARDNTGNQGVVDGNNKVLKNDNVAEENSVIKDGIQYITITARGGYSPKKSFATAGIPTKLIVKTNGTYDCSAALVIPSLKYRAMLPNTGETIIDAGTFKAGDTLQGVCGMGMYNFVVNFKS